MIHRYQMLVLLPFLLLIAALLENGRNLKSVKQIPPNNLSKKQRAATQLNISPIYPSKYTLNTQPTSP